MEVTQSVSKDFSLASKVAVVAGGASGIGRAIAETLAAHGASARVVDVDRDGAESVARGIRESGGQATAHCVDASDATAVERLFSEMADSSVLVNSIGMAHIGTLESTLPEDFERVFRVNVASYYNCMRAAVPHMKRNGGGVIVNIASIAGSAGLASRFAYSMSKGAVIAMTYSVARDYLADNIRCNCISPARIHTPLVDGYLKASYPGREAEFFEKLAAAQPIGRMGEPREVAALALFLCSDEAGFITGTDYPIDGGFLNLHG